MAINFDPVTDLAPADHLARVGQVFARFDGRTQDSGNVSFGVETAGLRCFVKTPGDPADTRYFLSHPERIDLLENAMRLARSVSHPALPPLLAVGRCAWGPMLIYAWAPGEVVHAPAARRDDPDGAHRRFLALPVDRRLAAIDTILDAHMALCAAGWVAGDFYDGSILYDFARHQTWLIDLDSYHLGPHRNAMGRMFGSSRFMAPEEFERGALIDERTTVFNLGRAMAEFIGGGSLDSAAFGGDDRQHRAMVVACQPDPARRFPSVAALAAAWRG